ncbi:hypothetical protein ATE77_04150 [Sphingopyxis sp. H005]|nr:hypothetical protein ATE70_08805 [Sphingopyxis sp. H053]KTE46070.1 hypothetical protein ATE77_04150 [Sphingopyxis sp. H005]KTE70738.1 hypothetical protein ATE74_02735 [Sphingopyxis sp. H085]
MRPRAPLIRRDEGEAAEKLPILFELWKRDVRPDEAPRTYDEKLEQDARRAAWNHSPACPDCGSYAHFECGGYPESA